MNTPICDFVSSYAESKVLRLHMPGHKGHSVLGFEQLDITEIDGADSLYEAEGIIRESEKNAGKLFGSETFYSTEGSSQCIRAMLWLALLHAMKQGKKPIIAAARNVHKTFLSAAALLDFEIIWLNTRQQDSYLSCKVNAQEIDELLSGAARKPTAVYLTSPDYLGNIADVGAVSEVCRRHGVLLIVDNAHGAYLRFLPRSMHPIDLGADLCCDSAHKTLPVLTGGAYLHISKSAPALLVEQAKNALALFGSTSPSYLILQSLDAANVYLAKTYPQSISDFVSKVHRLKDSLIDYGYKLRGDEPLKITIAPKSYGYEGKELAQFLLDKKIVCEFSDPDYIVFMLTPNIGPEGLEQLEDALLSIPRRSAINTMPPQLHSCEAVMSVREASLSLCETIPSKNSKGRILAAASVGCPPAVPIVVCGERIDEAAINAFAYYGIESCTVVIE